MACSGSDEGDDRGDRDPQAAREEPPTRPTRQAAISWEIQRRGGDPAALIEVLHQVQLQEGHLSPGALHQVARELRLPLSRVYGVASFYHLFRLNPPPHHRLTLCHGTACFVNGAERLEAILRARFAVGVGEPSRRGAAPSMAAGSAERTSDGRAWDREGPAHGDGTGGWRLERSGCLGACGHDPVLRLEDGPVVPLEACPVVRLPLLPAASLVDRLAALGLPLLPQTPAPAS